MKLVISSVIASLVMTVSAFADVAGSWNLSLTAVEGSAFVPMTVELDGEKASVTSDGHTMEGTYKDGKLVLEGDFFVGEAGFSSLGKMVVELSDDKLVGDMTWEGIAIDVNGTRAD